MADEATPDIVNPKVFISYSWTTPEHQTNIREWADRLVGDAIDVVLDLYDFKEGDDKYAFMERMVTDPSVSHVLVFSDKKYAEKSDARKAGVGTESQIISREVYEKVKQSKFIPIVCEFDPEGSPYLPTFLKARKWIDFSTPEAANENWEQLVRLLFGKPLYEKPKMGKKPAYLQESQSSPADPAYAKFSALRQAVLQGRKGIPAYRRDFLDACISFADQLRVRERPAAESFGQKVLEDCAKLKQVRNHIADWILLEAEATRAEEFETALIETLERLLHLKARPAELNMWNEVWFEAHKLFVYETFLYVVAALLKVGSYETLREVFTSHYLMSETERYGEERFERFDSFYGYSDLLNDVLGPENKRYYSAAAELIKRQADRQDIPFASIIEAELLILFMALIGPDLRWYPQTFHYRSGGRDIPLFIRATQHKHFLKLAKITGIGAVDELRAAVKKGEERLETSKWRDLHFRNFWKTFNMDKMDSIQ